MICTLSPRDSIPDFFHILAGHVSIIADSSGNGNIQSRKKTSFMRFPEKLFL